MFAMQKWLVIWCKMLSYHFLCSIALFNNCKPLAVAAGQYSVCELQYHGSQVSTKSTLSEKRWVDQMNFFSEKDVLLPFLSCCFYPLMSLCGWKTASMMVAAMVVATRITMMGSGTSDSSCLDGISSSNGSRDGGSNSDSDSDSSNSGRRNVSGRSSSNGINGGNGGEGRGSSNGNNGSNSGEGGTAMITTATITCNYRKGRGWSNGSNRGVGSKSSNVGKCGEGSNSGKSDDQRNGSNRVTISVGTESSLLWR